MDPELKCQKSSTIFSRARCSVQGAGVLGLGGEGRFHLGIAPHSAGIALYSELRCSLTKVR